jgi:hypothetical protein
MAYACVCSVPGCFKEKRRGSTPFCDPHYRRELRYGEPETGRVVRGDKIKWVKAHSSYEGERCLIWPFSRLSNGYGQILVSGRQTVASRFMCEVAHGAPPARWYEAAHSCGNGHLGCVHPAHLSWKTPVDNRADKLLHGTDLRGEKHPSAKLATADIHAIRELTGKMPMAAVARKYSVSAGTIARIQKGEGWSWLNSEKSTVGDK